MAGSSSQTHRRHHNTGPYVEPRSRADQVRINHGDPNRLSDYRRQAGLTQEQLVEKLEVLGREQNAPVRPTRELLSKWERGDTSPSLAYRRLLAAALDIDLSKLGFTEPSDGEDPSAADQLGYEDMLTWLASTSGRSVSELQARLLSLPSRGTPSSPPPTREAIAEALLAYYEPDAIRQAGLSPYELSIDGRPVRTSIVSKQEWLEHPLRLIHPSSGASHEQAALTASPPPQHLDSDTVVDAALMRLASAQTSSQSPVMIDRPIYRLMSAEITDGLLATKFSVDSFAHYALTADLLEPELLARLAQGRDGNDSLPLRSMLLPDAASIGALSARLCAGGPIALLAIARGPSGARPADFLLLVQQRSSRVLNVAGKLAVIPKGFHQHLTSAIDEVHIGTTLSRELEEEVFGRSDFDESEGRSPLPLNPHHGSRLTPQMQWLLEHDALDMECLGLGMNLVSGNYEFPSLITITDPRFWDEFSGACLPNWEAQDIQLHSTQNPDLLAELVQDPRWTNEGLFALTRGLSRLAEKHPDRVQLPSLEVTAYA